MENNDLLKQMLVSFLRKILFALGSYLVTRGWLTQDLSNTLLGDSNLWALAGGLIVIGTLVWQWAKVRFNVTALKVATQSNPQTTSVEEVKATVPKIQSLTTSL